MNFNCHFILLLLLILLLSPAISLDLKTGTIYKVQCRVTGNIFIGRTTIGISEAMRLNKSYYERYKRGTLKEERSLFEVLVNNDYNVTVLEEIYKLANDTDFLIKLTKMQKFYIELYDTAVNKKMPSRTMKEWVVENLDHISQQRKEHYEENKEAALQQQRAYRTRVKSSPRRKITCEVCRVEINLSSLVQHNKTKRHLTALAKLNSGSESGPQYEQQLSELLDTHKETCEVYGGAYLKASSYMHKKSTRHLTALAKLNQGTYL